MSLNLITPSVVLAVSLAEVKAHLRVSGTDDDTEITAMLLSAIEHAEQRTGRALTAQTWELAEDAFLDEFNLPFTPVQSITSVKYVDTAGVEQTLASSQYTLDNADYFGPSRVVPAFDVIWPGTRAVVNAVKVRFVSGYADAASVPAGIKSWIKLQVGAMYEHREAETEKRIFPLAFADRLLDRSKVWS